MSEDYYEKNLNAFNNNMSLLALNTYEITQQLGVLNKSNEQINSISKNIAAHTSFIKNRSEEMKRKLKEINEIVERQ